MTSRDFAILAEAVNGLDLTAEARAHVASRLAACLAREWPRFDRRRFVAACDPYRSAVPVLVVEFPADEREAGMVAG